MTRALDIRKWALLGLLWAAPLLGRGEEAMPPAPGRDPAQAVEVDDSGSPDGATSADASPAKTVETSPETPAAAGGDGGGGSKRWYVAGVLAPLDYWMPGKFGVLAAYLPDDYKAYEFEYVRGSFGFSLLGDDLGTALEQRLTVQMRYFVGDSLNYHAGVNYNYFRAELNKSYTSTVPSNPNDEDYELVEVATLGVTLGIGNRWQLDNGMEVGVDWLQLQLPFLRLADYSPFEDLTTDSRKRDAVRSTVHKVRDNPRFAAFRFQAGISF